MTDNILKLPSGRESENESLGADDEKIALRVENKTARNHDFFTELLAKAKEEYQLKWDYKHSNTIHNTRSSCLEDFGIMKTISRGWFGPVVQVQRKSTGALYVMKIRDKQNISKLRKMERILYEERISQSVNFPFLIKFECSFQDDSNLYTVSELVEGRDMTSQLARSGKVGEPQTRFYASQIVLVLEYLHYMDIVYRSLKLENVLIDSAGYIKVKDFGLAKRVTGKTWTLLGDIQYVAPEIILGKGYTRAVDWWALGALIYEMVAGRPPFRADQPFRLFKKIVSGELHFPSSFSSELKDLLSNLLQADATKRFGNLKNGAGDIKDHAWFSSTDWIALYHKHVAAPFVPKCRKGASGDAANAGDNKDTWGHHFAEF